MAYSGTVGQTVISVQTLIDHGARRCGKLAEELTSEQILSAKQSLYFLLSHLANKGINYWCINKTVYGLKADQYIYTMPQGTIDVLNVLYRTMNRPTGQYSTSAGGTVALAYDNDVDTYCQQTSANGNISVDYGITNPIYAGSIGFLPYVSGGGTATWSITLEYSVDGVTWSTLDDLGTIEVSDNQWVWTDIDPGQSVAGGAAAFSSADRRAFLAGGAQLITRSEAVPRASKASLRPMSMGSLGAFRVRPPASIRIQRAPASICGSSTRSSGVFTGA